MAAIPAARCISRRSGRSSEPGCEAGTHPSTGWAEGTACHQSGTPSLTGLQSWHGAITQSNENIIATDGAGWDGMGRDGMDSPRDRRLAAAAAFFCSPWFASIAFACCLAWSTRTKRSRTPRTEESAESRLVTVTGAWSTPSTAQRTRQIQDTHSEKLGTLVTIIYI